VDPRLAWLEALQHKLQQRREEHLLRELHPVASPQGAQLVIEGRTFVQFCTNNYLGLANDTEVIEAARAATARFGTGSGASRLVAGSMELHHELERELARFKRTEGALLFPTGYMANLAVLTTFAGERELLVSDKLNHASLIDAARFSGATHRTFVHRNAERARTLLAKETAGLKFLVTDSIFSMDGDVADLRALSDVADQSGAMLVIDEAHATGVLGERGAGLAELQGVEERVAITVGTLSKALGSIGGFVAGPRAAIDTLINEGRSFIYTTALPPACSAAALAALKIVQREPQRRERVMRLARHVKTECTNMGYDTGDSASPIIPVILGDPATALAASRQLRERGLYVPAIRPPTVPPNSARLRISLMATHTDSHVEQLLTAMRTLRRELRD
jgi:8-amino-7-oxononanoate synthase